MLLDAPLDAGSAEPAGGPERFEPIGTGVNHGQVIASRQGGKQP